MSTKRKVCALWRRVNDVASKFYSPSLESTGDEWAEFCEAMNDYCLDNNEKVREIIPDEELYKAFAHANYGDMSPRDVVRLGLLKTACGFSHGYTSTQILIELGLIVEKTRKAGREMLTDRGRRYLWHAWSEGEPF